jgi:putative transposase
VEQSIKESLSLGERVYQCESCSFVCDRDLNASLNLEKIGRATAEFTPVEKVLPTVFVEAGNNAGSSY